MHTGMLVGSIHRRLFCEVPRVFKNSKNQQGILECESSSYVGLFLAEVRHLLVKEKLTLMYIYCTFARMCTCA